MKNLWVLFLAISASVFASQFVAVPLKDQLKESDVVVKGIFTQAESLFDSNRIITKYTLKVIRAVGVGEVAPEEIYFYQPGGQIGDVGQAISGTAEFSSGEEVILTLKKVGERYWLLNLALGKYQKINQAGEIYWQSSVFPDHEELGKITDSTWEKELKNRFGQGFGLKVEQSLIQIKNENGKIVLENKVIKTRKPAQADEKDKPSTLLGLIAFVFILGLWLSRHRPDYD